MNNEQKAQSLPSASLEQNGVLGVMLNETELENDYPVNWDYLYVCDGKVIKSDIQGTVADLKRDLRSHYKLEAKVITTCDIEGRRKLAKLS